MKKEKLSEFAKYFYDKLSSKHKISGCFIDLRDEY